jgi:hypothetical protein
MCYGPKDDPKSGWATAYDLVAMPVAAGLFVRRGLDLHSEAVCSAGLHLFQELSTLGQQRSRTRCGMHTKYCALTSAPDQPHNPPRLKRAVLLLDSRFALLGQGRPSKSSNFIGTTSSSIPSGS